MNQEVRTRFAPSPTGYLHVGGLRTALFAYLFAKHNQGKFVLRIEDTDQARFIEGAIEKLINILNDIGLKYDEGLFIENGKIIGKGEHGPYLQSQRKEIYKEYAEKLVASGNAYYCFCDEKRLEELRKEQEALKQPTRYDRKCRNLSKEDVQTNLNQGLGYVIRQAIPLDGQTIVKDLVYKDIVWENKALDDQVLMKSDGFPTYHLAVVVDDHLMQISHVIRGEEWIPSTPKHILLYKAFDWQAPQFAHLPLLLNKDRSKLSKRQGDVAVEDYLSKGYLKEALINFIALLGWNPKTDQEIFSMQELIEQFDLTKVNKSGSIFDVEKLNWLNNIYIRKLSASELKDLLIPYLISFGLITEDGKKHLAKNGKEVSVEFLEAIAKIESERLSALSEIGERVNYFFEQPKYLPEILIWKKSDLGQTKNALKKTLDFLEKLSDAEFKAAVLENKLKEFISQNGFDNGSVLWPLRVALSGLEKSPNPFEIIETLHLGYGKFEILQRLEAALKMLE